MIAFCSHWRHMVQARFRRQMQGPGGRYLTGLGMATGKGAAECLQIAEDNARSNLIQSIRTRITSEFVSETSETRHGLDVSVHSRVVAGASLEVDGGGDTQDTGVEFIPADGNRAWVLYTECLRSGRSE
jgi:hypothetical protein